LLAIVCDGQVCYGNVCFLQQLQSGTVTQQCCMKCSLQNLPNAHLTIVHQLTQISITTNLAIHSPPDTTHFPQTQLSDSSSSSHFPSHSLDQGCSSNSSRATFCPRHSVTLPADTFEIRKCLLALSVVKPR
jgi:hypothetical protein